MGWWSQLPWIVSQLSQQGRQPVGALALLFSPLALLFSPLALLFSPQALLGELLQGLLFVQALLLSPLVFLLSPFLTGQNEVTIRIGPAQPGIRLAFVGA